MFKTMDMFPSILQRWPSEVFEYHYKLMDLNMFYVFQSMAVIILFIAHSFPHRWSADASYCWLLNPLDMISVVFYNSSSISYLQIRESWFLLWEIENRDHNLCD